MGLKDTMKTTAFYKLDRAWIWTKFYVDNDNMKQKKSLVRHGNMKMNMNFSTKEQKSI